MTLWRHPACYTSLLLLSGLPGEGIMAVKVTHMRPDNFLLPNGVVPVAPPGAAGRPSIRSTERRRWSADLVGPATAGLVLHGMGGIGKSVLAAEIVERAGRLQPESVIVLLSGQVSADRLLAALAAALRAHPTVHVWDRAKTAAVRAADRIDLPWDHRLGQLSQHVLRHVPVLVSLDGFDDNLTDRLGTPVVADPTLAGLLAGWARRST